MNRFLIAFSAAVIFLSAATPATRAQVVAISPPGCDGQTVYECPPVDAVDPSAVYSGPVVGSLRGGSNNPTAIYNLGTWTINLVGEHCVECADGQRVVSGTFRGLNYGPANHNATEQGVFSGVMNADGTTIDLALIPTNCFELGFLGETAGFYTGGSLGPDPGPALRIYFAFASDGQSFLLAGHLSGRSCVGWTVSTDMGINGTN